ncbi:MAG TPA: hypothetical protein ENI63_01465 [Candidatus Kaiserbacteria bacterium]|nr:hypothetical protein [Candidatus Kaiserbacteria bacterium]
MLKEEYLTKEKEIDLVKEGVPPIARESKIFQERLRSIYDTTDIFVSVERTEKRFGFTLEMAFRNKFANISASIFLEGIPTQGDKIRAFVEMQKSIERDIIKEYLSYV